MQIIKVTQERLVIYHNLAQAYEAEFSKIMQKKPDAAGRFPLDTELGGDVTGYLLYHEGVPAGLTAIAQEAVGHFEVCDFYIVPYFRQNQLGKQFIQQIFASLQGAWEIKQVAGADHAVRFWREVIGDYTQQNYREDQYQDPKWGWVTRQQFSHESLLKTDEA
ncbi:hypothetical protein VST7929_03049 [Vibrio stylophorae]|uniref:GNAT family N-acetyltransferase n=1 Tax=Vibrio stylophorae TaxID=659351 RepID=A0ABN8DVQ9_9VIBR|nr:hypothetical protein [Vibrio stylophorae]CAH0535475.1 hypothetical protein VST7929_03049 [Vibrio stylophorae]